MKRLLRFITTSYFLFSSVQKMFYKKAKTCLQVLQFMPLYVLHIRDLYGKYRIINFRSTEFLCKLKSLYEKTHRKGENAYDTKTTERIKCN